MYLLVQSTPLHITSNNYYLLNIINNMCPEIILSYLSLSYYESGTTAVLSDFFDPIVLDKFMDTVGEIPQIIMHHRINVELWLGETSSCFGGGAPVLSSSYIAGFMQVTAL